MERMNRGERFAFVDARGAMDRNEPDGRLPGAIRVPSEEVEEHVKDVPQGRPIIAYCTCPNEACSTLVALELMRRGFLNVHPLIGGVGAWRRAGGRVEPMQGHRR
jgi:rhodanese-related sulfurtransferase